MTRLACVLVAMVMVPVRAGLAQNPPAPPPAPAPTTQPPQVDRSWLTVDSTSKTATFQLTAGLTAFNSALNFNGFKDGGLTLTVPVNWNVVIQFTNHDANLPHSAEVIDMVKPMPAGPMDPAFPHAATTRLQQGIAAEGKDTFRFTANKAGSYMIFCGVPGHGLAGMWIQFRVSATENQPTLTATGAAGGR